MNRKLFNATGLVLTTGAIALGGLVDVQPAFADHAGYAGASCEAGGASKVEGFPGSLGNTSTTKTLLVVCPHATTVEINSVTGGHVAWTKPDTSALSCAMRYSDFLGTNVVSSPTRSTRSTGTSFFGFGSLTGFIGGQVYYTCTLPKASSASAYTRITGYRVTDNQP